MSFSSKLPSLFVIVPIGALATYIFTPIRGSLEVASLTYPVIEFGKILEWAKIKVYRINNIFFNYEPPLKKLYYVVP